ncbi:uncharacterized protein LOC133299184 [Gastrolobium bilobum]|uniref:uncharacterized protein LOC133299184 n=1 Tax=Gastrolobium bilobum TaxID=150636 RepID=UPI002AB2A0AB|nr:uncharacterized protein LOC133299184 [Gastrolobium bilobum]
MYGKPPPDLVAYSLGSSLNEAVDTTLSQRNTIMKTLKENLRRAQQIMKAHADKGRKDYKVTVRDLVLLRLQPYRQVSVHRRSSQKLSLRYYSTFEVLDKIGKVAYCLKLPHSAMIHDVFHISMLRPFKSGRTYTLHDLPDTTNDDSPMALTPCGVVGSRSVWRNG